MSVSFPSLYAVELWRVRVNTWLIKRLRCFDVADNPALIYELDLADLLHVCKRKFGLLHWGLYSGVLAQPNEPMYCPCIRHL